MSTRVFIKYEALPTSYSNIPTLSFVSDTALIGLVFVNKNKSVDDYMFGNRRLSLVPVTVSMMSSSVSGISLFGHCTEYYYHGLEYTFTPIGFILSGPVTAYTVLPMFYRLDRLSLYSVGMHLE